MGSEKEYCRQWPCKKYGFCIVRYLILDNSWSVLNPAMIEKQVEEARGYLEVCQRSKELEEAIKKVEGDFKL